MGLGCFPLALSGSVYSQTPSNSSSNNSNNLCALGVVGKNKRVRSLQMRLDSLFVTFIYLGQLLKICC